MSSSVHGALAELIGEVSRRDGGVRDTASTPSSRCATPPICSANRGRQYCQPACGSLVGKQRNVLLCSRSLGGVNRGGVPQGRRG